MRTDDDWQEWEFPQLLEALRKWTIRNPPKTEERFSHVKPPPWKLPRERNYHVNQQEPKRRPCVYCENPNHQSVKCDKIATPSERRKQLALKQLCFNCTGTNHKVAECRITAKCKFCHHRHHSSICDQKTPQQAEHMQYVHSTTQWLRWMWAVSSAEHCWTRALVAPMHPQHYLTD